MFNFILGLVAGGILGLISFRLLRQDIIKSKEINKEKIRALFFAGYLKRYILIALVLAGCLFFKGVLFFLGSVVGLLVSFYLRIFPLCLIPKP